MLYIQIARTRSIILFRDAKTKTNMQNQMLGFQGANILLSSMGETINTLLCSIRQGSLNTRRIRSGTFCATLLSKSAPPEVSSASFPMGFRPLSPSEGAAPRLSLEYAAYPKPTTAQVKWKRT